MQKSAIRALARLDGQSYAETICALVKSDIPGLSRTASAALKQAKLPIDARTLWDAIESGSDWLAKRNAILLLRECDKWNQLIYLLKAASLKDTRVGELANTQIESWLRQYETTWQYTPPDEQQKKELVSFSPESTVPPKLRQILAAI